MYDYLIDQAQARRERVWAEIEQDRLIGQVKQPIHKSSQGVSTMQFNRQKVAALLLAGLILVTAIGLIRAEANAGQANREINSVKADEVSFHGGLSPEFHLNSVKGGRPAGGGGGDVQR
ncbi:MAG: hypothetical protein U0401_05790 [Anaerolineae bacterium]